MKTPSGDCSEVRAEHPQATDEDGHLRSAQGQQVRPVDEEVLGRQP